MALNVLKVVSGFPSPEKPFSGAIHRQAVEDLGQYTDLTVAALRAIIPKRRLVDRENQRFGRLIRVSLPAIPPTIGPNWPFVLEAPLLLLKTWLGGCILRNEIQQADVIHSVYAASTGQLAGRWSRYRGSHAAHVVQVIGSDLNVDLPVLDRSPIVRGWQRRVDGVSCNSRALYERFTARYPDVENVRVIYRGVNLKRFNPENPPVGQLAEKTGVRFLFLGGFPRYPNSKFGRDAKGGETLMRAWEEAETDPAFESASLMLGGRGSQDPVVKRWRAELRRPEAVFLAGPQPVGQIPGLMTSADVVLLPSLMEGVPNVAMEASASGRPVFGSRTGGVPEIIRGNGGLLLEAGDVKQWRDALVAAADGTLDLRAMGIAARSCMEQYFDHHDYARNMLDLYDASIRHRKPSFRTSN